MDEYHHNILSEKLLSKVDEEVKESIIMKEISDKNINKYTIREWKKGLITTKRWKLLVKWKDGTQDWIPLKNIKESNPVETVEYYDLNNLIEEPAFKWCANKVLKNNDRIISRVRSRYWRTSHKFGINLPYSVEEAYAIYEENGNTFWRYSIDKKLKIIRCMETFEIMEGFKPEDIQFHTHPMPGYR